MIAIFSVIQFFVYGAGSAFELVVTSAVCFHFVFAYFIALTVVIPILAIGRFGAGLGVYIPFATLGSVIEYYMEWAISPTLIAPWAAAFWGIFGLLTGLAGDLAYRFLPQRLQGAWRAICIGIIVELADFGLTAAVLLFPYKDPVPGLTHFFHGWFLMLPFLVISAAFAGYTGHALAQGMKMRLLEQNKMSK